MREKGIDRFSRLGCASAALATSIAPHYSGVIVQKWVSDIPHTPFRWHWGVVEVPILNHEAWRGAW